MHSEAAAPAGPAGTAEDTKPRVPAGGARAAAVLRAAW